MSTVLKAGNASTGGSFTPDNTGILEVKTGSGVGTTAITVDASQNVTFTNSIIRSGTAVASTSGTSIDFTSLPTGIKRITVMFSGVSLSGTADYIIQIGSGSVTSTGYLSGGTFQGSTNSVSNRNATNGFVVPSSNIAASLVYGTITLVQINTNIWVNSSCLGVNGTGTSYSSTSGGVSPTLSGALDRVRITTSNGTDTFDAGSINILYE